MPAQYDTGVIRELLLEAFNDAELTIMVRDSADFREALPRFAPNMSLLEKGEVLIEFAERRERLENLLKLIKQANPEKFKMFVPRLLATRKQVGQPTSGAVTSEQSRLQPAPMFPSIRPTVDSLSACTYCFDEAQDILKSLAQLSKTVEALLKDCSTLGWNSTDVRVKINGELIHTLGELSTLMTRLTRRLDNMKGKLEADDYGSLAQVITELGQVLPQVETSRNRLLDGCSQIMRAMRVPTEAALLEQCRQQVHVTLADLNNLLSIVDAPARRIHMDMYVGIKKYVNKLASITGSDKEVQ